MRIVLFIASALDGCRKLKDGGEESIEAISSDVSGIELAPKRLGTIVESGILDENDDDSNEALNSLSNSGPKPLIREGPKIPDKIEASECKLKLRLDIEGGITDGVKAID